MTKLNFWSISPLLLRCETRNGCQNVVYGSIMLKIVLVAHLTYENQWGEYQNSDFCSFGDTLLCIPLCLSLSCWCRSLETQLHREQSWCFPFEFVDKIAHIVRSVEIDNIPCIPSSLKVIQTKVIQNFKHSSFYLRGFLLIQIQQF